MSSTARFSIGSLPISLTRALVLVLALLTFVTSAVAAAPADAAPAADPGQAPARVAEMARVTLTTPEIAGVPELGETLTASTVATPSKADVSFRWFRIIQGQMQVPVGDDTATYALQDGDVGHQIVVLAEASAPGYADAEALFSTPTDVVTDPGSTLPASFTVRAVGGQRVGDVMTVQTDLDEDHGFDLTYEWRRPGGREGIIESRESSFELPAYLVGVGVTVRVTAADGPSRLTQESESFVVQRGRHDASGLRITGRRVGTRLGAVYHDRTRPEGYAVSYRWRIGGRVAHATGRTVRPPRAAAGKRVVVIARLTAPGYRPQTLRSPAVRLR